MCLPCTADYSRLLSGHTLVPSSRWINDCCVILGGLMLHFCCSTNDASALLWVSHRCEAVKLFVVIPLWWMYNQAHRFKSQMCGKTMIMYFKEIFSTGKFWLMCIFPSCWISLPSVFNIICYYIYHSEIEIEAPQLSSVLKCYRYVPTSFCSVTVTNESSDFIGIRFGGKCCNLL